FFGRFHRCTTNIATNLRGWIQARLFRFNNRDNANEAAGRPGMGEDSIHHIDRIARSIYCHEYLHFDSKSDSWRYAPDQGTPVATAPVAGGSACFSKAYPRQAFETGGREACPGPRPREFPRAPMGCRFCQRLTKEPPPTFLILPKGCRGRACTPAISVS